MLSEIWNGVVHLFFLTGNIEVLWTVLPLILATIIMVVYFQRYKEERPGWNDHVANSLILLFVAMTLFRHIYEIDMFGAGNYIEYPGKTISVLFLLLIGMIVIKFNFEHLLPEVVARHISSPLTVNTLAYMVVLYVHTTLENSWTLLVSIILYFLVILGVLNLIKWPVRKLFDYMKKLKKKEKVKNIKQERFEIEEMKKELKRREKNLEKNKMKELENQKKEAIMLKKEIRK